MKRLANFINNPEAVAAFIISMSALALVIGMVVFASMAVIATTSMMFYLLCLLLSTMFGVAMPTLTEVMTFTIVGIILSGIISYIRK